MILSDLAFVTQPGFICTFRMLGRNALTLYIPTLDTFWFRLPAPDVLDTFPTFILLLSNIHISDLRYRNKGKVLHLKEFRHTSSS